MSEPKKRGPPKRLIDFVPMYLRIAQADVDALDAWVVELARDVPGGQGITRTDLIRDVVHRALEERRTRQAAPPAPKTKAPPAKGKPKR